MTLYLGEDCTIDIGFKDFGPVIYDPMNRDFNHKDLRPVIRVNMPGTSYCSNIEVSMTYKQAAEIKEGINKIWENIEKGETNHG